jgi:hypothetical protein
MKYLSSIDANDIVRFTSDEAIVSYTAKHCCRLFKASGSASYHREKYTVLSFRLKYAGSPANSGTGMAHDGLHGVDRILATVAVMLNVAVANLDIAIANTVLPSYLR